MNRIKAGLDWIYDKYFDLSDISDDDSDVDSDDDVIEEEETEEEEMARLLRAMRAAAGGTTTTDAAAARSQTGVDGATSATEDEVEEPTDQCGLDPDPEGLWVEVGPDPRIKECRLTDEEKTKFLGHLALIFGEDALLGQRLVFEPEDVMEVLEKVIPYLQSEPMLIEDVPFDVVIVADLHGQLNDLNRIFQDDAKDGKPGWENMRYVFLGNYVDRGRQSLEVVMALFCLKMLYPDRIFLLRGNHEFMSSNKNHGFPLEIKERYKNEDTTTTLYAMANTTFCWLSVAAIVGNIYYCAHGGISTAGFTRKFMRRIAKPYEQPKDDFIVHNVIFSRVAKGLRGAVFGTDGTMHYGTEELVYALQNMETVAMFSGGSVLEQGFDKVCGHLCTSLYSATGQTGTNKGATAHVGPTGSVHMRVYQVDKARVAWDAELVRLDDGEPDYKDEKTRHLKGTTPTIVG